MGTDKEELDYKSWWCSISELFANASFVDYLFCRPSDPAFIDEKKAFIIHGWARAPLAFCVSSFLNPYLTTLAKFSAAQNIPYSKVSWLGIPMRATSYISFYTTVLTILIAVLSPYFGAIADTTPYRRRYLAITTNLASILCILLVVVSASTWWLGGLLAILAIASYEISLVFVYAYLPEIGDSDEERSKVSVSALAWTNFSQVITTAFIAVLIIFLNRPSIGIQNGSFEKDSFNWSIADTSSLNPTALAYCDVPDSAFGESFECSRLKLSRAPEGFHVLNIFGNGLSSLVLYQNSSESADNFQSIDLLLTAWVKTNNASQLSLDIVDNGIVKSSRNMDAPDKNGFYYITHLYRTDSQTSQLTYLINLGYVSAAQVDFISVSALPPNDTSLFMFFCGIWFLIFGMMSILHFGKRDASFELESEKGARRCFQLFMHSNKKLLETCTYLWKNPVTGTWFFAYAIFASGATATLSLSGVFYSEQLGLSSAIIGIVFLVAQLVGILGAFLFHVIGKKIGYQKSLLLSYILFSACVILGFILLVDESSKAWVWPISLLFGVAIGSSIALSRAAVSGMIPIGREAEFMGFYNFSNKVFSWMGTLLFTLVNEQTGSIRFAFLSISGLFVLAAIFQGIVCVFYKEGVRDNLIVGNLTREVSSTIEL